MEKLLQQRQMLLVWLATCSEDKEDKVKRLEKQIDKIDNLLEDYFKNIKVPEDEIPKWGMQLLDNK